MTKNSKKNGGVKVLEVCKESVGHCWEIYTSAFGNGSEIVFILLLFLRFICFDCELKEKCADSKNM